MSSLAYEGDSAPFDLNAIVSENIRALAARRRAAQSDIAHALGVSQAAVSSKYVGRRPWSMDDVARVAAYFGVTPWALCTPLDMNNGGEPTSRLAPVPDLLPRLDSNQQPSDYMHGLHLVREDMPEDMPEIMAPLASVVDLGARLRA